MKVCRGIQILVCAAALTPATVPCLAQATAGSCPVTGADLAKVGTETKMDFVPGWSKPESQFREDKDPQTLQVVELSDKNSGPNSVSSDGQVLFYHKDANDAVVQKLLLRAFYIRFVLANHLTSRCDGPWSQSQRN